MAWLRYRIHTYGLCCITFMFCLVTYGCAGEDERSEHSETSDEETIRFTHVTAEAGLGTFTHEMGAEGKMWFPETVGGGAGFLDYDGDTWLDIVLVGGGRWEAHSIPAVSLFRNNQDGTFTDVTRETGLADVHAFGMGVSVADYDNDGDPDLFLGTVGQNLLLQNNRSEAGTEFVDVTAEAGLGSDEVWSTSAMFFDADLDGHTDLYVGNYVDWSPQNDIRCTMDGETKSYCTPQLYQGIPGHFYKNNGDGTFNNSTEAAGFTSSPGKTLGMAEWDINQDGWPDVVVANDTQRDLLYINNGNGTFNEEGVLSGIAFGDDGQARAGMGIDIAAIDASGNPSIAIGHFSKEMMGFYQRTGPAMFADKANQVQVGRSSIPTLTFGLSFVDVNIDGWIDLFVGNGHIDASIERVEPGNSYKQLPQLFMNQGNGRFEEFTAFIADPMVARGVATGDYDRDGDEDILITENGGPVHLLRNDQLGGNSLQIRLVGKTGNKDGLGAHITAVVGNNRIHRRVRTGSSFLISSSKEITIGLGEATRADSLIIEWPGTGIERLTGLSAGFLYEIVEGEGVGETVPHQQNTAQYVMPASDPISANDIKCSIRPLSDIRCPAVLFNLL